MGGGGGGGGTRVAIGERVGAMVKTALGGGRYRSVGRGLYWEIKVIC